MDSQFKDPMFIKVYIDGSRSVEIKNVNTVTREGTAVSFFSGTGEEKLKVASFKMDDINGWHALGKQSDFSRA